MGLPGVLLLLKLISFLVASFLLAHLLALFGPFIVITYPLWWLLAPRQTVCFGCRVGEEGDYCHLCRKKINKQNGVNPENFLSAVLNGAVILFFSVISIGLVYAESRLLGASGLVPVERTAEFIIPSKSQYFLNETFPLRLELDKISGNVNTVRADLGYDPDALEVTEVSTEGSDATVFIEKTINNTGGYVRLTGGLPNPGHPGPRFLLGSVYFKAKRPGIAEIKFLPSTLALANDGKGTNILKDFGKVAVLILNQETKLEKNDRKALELSQLVLGEQSLEATDSAKNGTKMYFWEENNQNIAQGPAVLGEEISTTSPQLGSWLINLLKAADAFILRFWSKILPFKP